VPKTILTGVNDDTVHEEIDWKDKFACIKKFKDMFCHKMEGTLGQDWMQEGKIKDIISEFMKMAGPERHCSNEEAKEGEERHCRGRGNWFGHHGHHGHHDWKFGGERSSWGLKRATIVSKTEEVLIGEPGRVVFAQVEVKNDTKWPWKRGCYVGLVDKSGVLIVNDLPIA